MRMEGAKALSVSSVLPTPLTVKLSLFDALSSSLVRKDTRGEEKNGTILHSGRIGVHLLFCPALFDTIIIPSVMLLFTQLHGATAA